MISAILRTMKPKAEFPTVCFLLKRSCLDFQWSANKNWDHLGNCRKEPILAKFLFRIMNQDGHAEIPARNNVTKQLADFARNVLVDGWASALRWMVRGVWGLWQTLAAAGKRLELVSAMQCTPRIRRRERLLLLPAKLPPLQNNMKLRDGSWSGRLTAAGVAGGAAGRLGGTSVAP